MIFVAARVNNSIKNTKTGSCAAQAQEEQIFAQSKQKEMENGRAKKD